MANTGINPEFPSPEQMRAYGDLAFLYFRAEEYRDVPLHLVRRAIQPAIDLGFYKVFHQDDVPRYAVTWAFLSPEAEARLVRGEVLLPAEWRSGPSMWVMDIVAPYGHGSAAATVKWLKKTLPDRINRVRFLRVSREKGIERVLEVRRMKGSQWGTRKLTPEQILTPAEAG